MPIHEANRNINVIFSLLKEESAIVRRLFNKYVSGGAPNNSRSATFDEIAANMKYILVKVRRAFEI